MFRNRRTLYIFLLCTVVLLGLFAYSQRMRYYRLRFARSMFSGVHQVENFRNMRQYFPTRLVRRGEKTFTFSQRPRALPETYEYMGQEKPVADLLELTDTTGLLVVQDDHIVFEEYWRGNDASTRWISWSVAKSFISALVGIALEEGKIRSIEDAITDYVPELIGSGYEGVRIKDILQMSSGVRWDETYSDPNSDINRMGRTFALGTSFDDFAATMEPHQEPGTFHRYASMDTQVLGMLLVRTTRQTISDYLSEKLWQPLGMEHDAYFLTDESGMELAMGGLNATLRDYAKFGRLYLRGGNWEGKQLVPEKWVRASISPDAPHLMPGNNPASNSPWGYGYQWWVPTDPDGEFMAVGIYNQFIYVYPKKQLVIVKTSANHLYATDPLRNSDRLDEHIAFFRAIARSLP